MLKSHQALEDAFQALYSGSQDVVSGTDFGVHEVVSKILNYPVFIKRHRSRVEGKQVTVLALYYSARTAIDNKGYHLAFAILACRPSEKTGIEQDFVVTEHQMEGRRLNGGEQAIIQEIEIMLRKLGAEVVEAPVPK